MLATDNYECTWELFNSIPSLEHPGKSVFDETVEFNEIMKSCSKARLIDRNRSIVDVKSMGFTMADRTELLAIAEASEEKLGSTRITDWLSTTIPMARTSPNSVSRFTENPKNGITAKAPMMVTGTVVAGIKTARQSCKNTSITTSTNSPASKSVLYTSWIAEETKTVVSKGMSYSMPFGNDLASLSRASRTSLATFSAFAPGS